MTLHTYNRRTNVPTKYQLPTPYGFQNIAWTKFSNSRSLQQSQRLNQVYIKQEYFGVFFCYFTLKYLFRRHNTAMNLLLLSYLKN